ncbi:MAG: YIP1 family protein [Candidatus Brockarchaeota archaeon]|nr:YIP1 family protein [Candidatus Brockarchaeota archaeon]
MESRLFAEVVRYLRIAKAVLAEPHGFFQRARSEAGAKDAARFYLAMSAILAFLTPVANLMGFPSDVIHASTNAQMAAFKYAPIFELYVGGSRHVWTGILTFAFMAAKLPVFVAFYHVSAKVLGGKGGWTDSLRVAAYSATPAMAFGWLPYSDFLFGLWAGLLIVPALHYLHAIPWGISTAYASFLLGFQILYVVLTGGGWLIEP